MSLLSAHISHDVLHQKGLNPSRFFKISTCNIIENEVIMVNDAKHPHEIGQFDA